MFLYYFCLIPSLTLPSAFRINRTCVVDQFPTLRDNCQGLVSGQQWSLKCSLGLLHAAVDLLISIGWLDQHVHWQTETEGGKTMQRIIYNYILPCQWFVECGMREFNHQQAQQATGWMDG